MNNNDKASQRPTLLNLYQAVEAATSRQQVFQILKEYAYYQDSQSGTDWTRSSNV
jgi:hypothetical protein